MRFSSNSTPEQAATYLRFIAAREPYVLQFLARSMAQSGGPIEEMDASFTSLNSLWGWAIDYVTAGCPGADEHYARLREQTGEGGKEWEVDPIWIAMKVGEGIDYYLHLVWQRYSPPAPWKLYETPGRSRMKDADHHNVGISLDGEWTQVDFGSSSVAMLLDGHGAAKEPRRLGRVMLMSRDWSEWPALPPGPSVLTPFVDADLGPMPPDGQISLKALQAEVRANEVPVVEPAAGEPVTLWRGPFDALDDPSLAGALDAEHVASVLGDLGFVDGDGARPTASALRTASGDGIELCIPSMDAAAALIASNGELRLVHVEPVEISRSGWRRVRAELKKLAKTQTARLVTDSDIM